MDAHLLAEAAPRHLEYRRELRRLRTAEAFDAQQSRVIRTDIQKTSNSPPANSTSPTTYPSRWAVSKAATLCR